MLIQRFNPKWEQYRNNYVEYRINKFQYKNQASKERCLCGFKTAINQLYGYLTRAGIENLNEITNKTLTEFQKFMHSRSKLLPHTTKKKFVKLKAYFSYLANQGIVRVNPFNDVRLIPEINIGRITVKRHYSIQELIDRYRSVLRKGQYTVITTEIKLKNINLFIKYLNNRRKKDSLYKVTEQDIREYREYLKQYQYEPGRYYSAHNQIQALRILKQFFRSIYIRGYLSKDPMCNFNCKEHKQELEKEYKIRLDPPDPEALIPAEIKMYRDKYIEYLGYKGYTERTIETNKHGMKQFIKFLNQKSVKTLKEIDKKTIEDYQNYIRNDVRTKEGKKLKISSVFHRLTQLRGFFKFLVKKEYITKDYGIYVDLPKKTKGIPRNVMTERETNIILNQPDIMTPIGIRDKAALEILYSSGIRANELAHVKTDEIDLIGGLIRIEVPKGGADYKRIVPIGKIACYYTKKYIKTSRVELLRGRSAANEYLFLTVNGRKTNGHIINNIVRKHAYKSRIRKHITTHSFRHTCATHMLKNGAGISYVQEQLGHKDIRSTQIYIRLIPKDLKKIHEKCHPRERIPLQNDITPNGQKPTGNFP